MQLVGMKSHVLSVIRNALGAMSAFSLAMLLFMLQASLEDPGFKWMLAAYAFVVSLPICVGGYLLGTALINRESVSRFTSRLIDVLGSLGLGIPVGAFGLVLETYSTELSMAYGVGVALIFLVVVTSLSLEARPDVED